MTQYKATIYQFWSCGILGPRTQPLVSRCPSISIYRPQCGRLWAAGLAIGGAHGQRLIEQPVIEQPGRDMLVGLLLVRHLFDIVRWILEAGLHS